MCHQTSKEVEEFSRRTLQAEAKMRSKERANRDLTRSKIFEHVEHSHKIQRTNFKAKTDLLP